MKAAEKDGTTTAESPTTEMSIPPIDWSQSAGIFIGVERFRKSAATPVDVRFGVDDAIDLANMFVNDELLPARQAVVILAGKPHKRRSQASLLRLQGQATVILEDPDDTRTATDDSVDAGTIYSQIDRARDRVGPNGILILSIATHGFTTTNGQHYLFTADASVDNPRGVVIEEMLRHYQVRPGGTVKGRLLLLVDACRTQIASQAGGGRGSEVRQADLRGAWPVGRLDNLKVSGSYAIMSAAGPGGFAYCDDRLQQGLFTYALLESLKCNTALVPTGILTLSDLESHVGERVKELSHDRQQPESRFGSGSSGLELVQCPACCGEIISPKPGAHVNPSGVVDFRVCRPRFFATVLVCAANNGVCFNQNPSFTPVVVLKGQKTVPVQYGRPDGFDVYVALSRDADFLSGEAEFPGVPTNRRGKAEVCWLGPVNVVFPDQQSLRGSDHHEVAPAINSPRDKQRLGLKGDPLCPKGKDACHKIVAEGSVPKGKTPFFAVEPALASPKAFIQPEIHGVRSDGSFDGPVNLGTATIGKEQHYTIYVFACDNPHRFHEGQQILHLPEDCQVSSPVTVYRVR